MPTNKDTKHYVKFLGSSKNRVPMHTAIRDVIRVTSCNRAVGFSVKRRPTAFNDGDVIYLARMTEDPNDFVIFGKAEAIRFNEHLHMAPRAEIDQGIWHDAWPCLPHERNPVFIDGTLREGISLYEMLDALDHESFVCTLKNFRWNMRKQSRAQRNVEPRRSLLRQAGMYLTPRAAGWLDERIEKAL